MYDNTLDLIKSSSLTAISFVPFEPVKAYLTQYVEIQTEFTRAAVNANISALNALSNKFSTNK